MLPMAMHRKQEHPKRKQKYFAVTVESSPSHFNTADLTTDSIYSITASGLAFAIFVPQQTQNTSATSRSGRLSLEHTILEEGLKPGPYSFSSSTISENVPDMESGGEVKKSSCAAIMISNSKTSRVGIPNRNLSVTVNNLPTKKSYISSSMDVAQ
ncbi:hypothetical protein DINM_002072 [Dirofilaria immitis]|nr:hypothetical protein [Dirofilaria immitis]